jgi:acylphosphatase
LTKRVSIQVFGKVQGVWFRKHVLNVAQRLSIIGFVKNLPDGTVYMEAGGQVAELNTLAVACKKGSPLSTVDRIEVQELKRTGKETDFRIIR